MFECIVSKSCRKLHPIHAQIGKLWKEINVESVFFLKHLSTKYGRISFVSLHDLVADLSIYLNNS